MYLKKLVSFMCLIGTLSATQNLSLLSSLKQEKLRLDKKKIELDSSLLKYNWLRPIMGRYSISKTDNKRGSNKTLKSFSITLDQPIFKSGGIYYAIKYATANRKFLRLSATLNEKSLIKNLISSWLELKKYNLLIKRQEYLIANAKIEIIRKKEQYDSGFLDSGFLDRAILSKTLLMKNIIDMKSRRDSELLTFNSLSDFKFSDLKPPEFEMITKKDFIKNSLIMAQLNAKKIKKEYFKKLTITNYLPTVSLHAGYYDMPSMNTNDSYNQIGLNISMPILDINAWNMIEVKQLEYLRSKIDLEDAKQKEENMYYIYVKKIGYLNKKIEILLKDVKLYDSLIGATKESFEVGEKTSYDVKNLENSKSTISLDKQIYEIDIQKILLELHSKVNSEI